MRNKTPGVTSLLIAAAALGGAASVAQAQDATAASSTNAASATMTAPMKAAAPDDDSWRFGVTLPLWAPEINGNVTVRGRTQDVSVSFDELKDHLDAAFSVALDAHKGKFGLYGDMGYMKFSGGIRG